MVPNIFGMGLYADGGKISTKPYIASANYINKMSNYCQNCQYDKNLRTGKTACPFNYMYWHFLLTYQTKLEKNPRMSRMLSNIRFLDENERLSIVNEAQAFIEAVM